MVIGIFEIIIVFFVLALFVGVPVTILVTVLSTRKQRDAAVSAKMINCSLCGRMISPNADRCPQCGEPRRVA